jgi:hypothetical protein
MYVRKMRESVVILQSQKGSASKNFGKHYFREVLIKRLYADGRLVVRDEI